MFCPAVLGEDETRCGELAAPVDDPVMLGGTAIVELQRYRCAGGHWWDDARVLVEDVPA